MLLCFLAASFCPAQVHRAHIWLLLAARRGLFNFRRSTSLLAPRRWLRNERAELQGCLNKSDVHVQDQKMITAVVPRTAEGSKPSSSAANKKMEAWPALAR
eukprot:4847785-Amphidinium_carterae.1